MTDELISKIILAGTLKREIPNQPLPIAQMSKRNSKDRQVSSLELKFLLSLLISPDYRASITQIRPSTKTSASERAHLCRSLCQKGLVAYEEAVTRFSLTAAGRTLLTLDTTILPIIPDEKLILQSCQGGSVAPENIHVKVPLDQQQRLIEGLAQRGLLKVTQRQIGAVWITDEGQTFLRDECAPQGNSLVLSWTQLSGYLQFMRQSRCHSENDVSEVSPTVPQTAVTPDDLLQMIIHLDAVLKTENYLPIYHLRAKLQPPLSSQGLDQQLYQLQREDRIDLSTLQDVTQYRQEEVAAGIPQNIGGPLFFISVM